MAQKVVAYKKAHEHPVVDGLFDVLLERQLFKAQFFGQVFA